VAAEVTPCGTLDSHQHFWRIDRRDYGWLTAASGTLYRDYQPTDLEPLLRERHIDGTIVVQAAPTVAETRYLLSLARSTPWIRGVVGWVDMSSPAAPADLAQLARGSRLCGIRHMIQDIADTRWMLEPALEPTFEALIELDLGFDALVRPEHLPNLLTLLQRYPELRATIDHGAKPDIAGHQWQPWADWIAAIATETSACCKLSGLVTEAAPDWTTESIAPFADHLLDAFGPDRLMWGSDWPVVNLAGGYERWWSFTQAWLESMTAADAQQILGGAAIAFYRLE